LPDEWQELIIVLIYKGDKPDCSNYRGITLLASTYKILSNILLSRLTPNADEIIGYLQCNFDATGLGGSIHTIKNTETLVVASKETGL